jgi:2-polyprenyl-3-methyl-5-hydroxy-6-metoxy-1,4-benzoquinol methylase
MKLFKSDFEDGYHERLFYREAQNSQRNRARLNVLLERRQAGTLLEIGCGMAGFLRLAEEHFAVHCLDVSNHAIATIREHFGERVSVSNVEQDPLPADRYDVIVVFNILEHLRRPDEALRKIAVALKSGGLMIGSVPNNFGLVGGLTTRIGNFFDRTHVSTYDPQTWRAVFQQAGFTRIDFFGEVPIGLNHSRYLYHRLWPYLSFNLMFFCQGPL